MEAFCSVLHLHLLPVSALFCSDADIKVLCSPAVIGIRAKEDFFMYHNVSLELLHLPNTTCRALKTTVNNVTYYTSRISKENYLTCGGRPLEVQLNKSTSPFAKVPYIQRLSSPLQKNFTHITYSLSLTSNPHVHGNIIRNPVIRLDFKCVFPYVRRVSLPFPIIPYSM